MILLLFESGKVELSENVFIFEIIALTKNTENFKTEWLMLLILENLLLATF